MPEWMAFNVDDYVSNTLHLTARQHGGYILLICAAWKGKGALPGSDDALRTIAKLTPKEWKTDGDVLKAFLTRRGDVWVHERVEFEWQDAHRLIDAKSKAGKEGARKRWQGRTGASANDGAMAVPSGSQSQIDAPQPLPLPEPTVTTTDQVERENGLSPGAPPAEPVTPPDDLAPPLRLDRSPEAQAVVVWNEAAEQAGWPKVQVLTATRRKAPKARLAECGGLDGWQAAIRKARHSAFLTGRSGRTGEHANWRCDIDFILRQAKFTKLMEGGFDDRSSPQSQARSGLGSALEALADWGRTRTG